VGDDDDDVIDGDDAKVDIDYAALANTYDDLYNNS
jgi:hypothetical protein